MRSILTSLGIIIGVSSVIIMLAIGMGAQRSMAENMAKMGSNLLMVVSGSTTSGGIRMGAGSKQTLTYSDALDIQKKCPSVLAVAPYLSGTKQVVFGNQNWSTGIQGTTPNVMIVRDWGVEYGRSFSEEDVSNSTKVCLLGQTVAENLFGDLDPVGKTVRIEGMPFTVVGVLESKGQSGMGQDQDDTIMIPITTAQKKLIGVDFPGMVRHIMVKAVDEDAVYTAQEEIEELLRTRHRLGSKQEDDFTIRNLTQMMETAKESAKIMAILLGSIASVSLLVGGIGIMNIMLVSVTERTKEIGIRMAIGAKASDIRIQFLLESLLLSLMGGTVGVVLGILLAKIVEVFFDLPVYIAWWSLLLSFGFSGIVGVTFGYYPAYRASLLDPIEALRYE
ncbi:MAG TPA: ABC transporter permease [Candidatus Adamsella sp.]|nr:ABC transporter permease [Candidatus Adamsella sp.]